MLALPWLQYELQPLQLVVFNLLPLDLLHHKFFEYEFYIECLGFPVRHEAEPKLRDEDEGFLREME